MPFNSFYFIRTQFIWSKIKTGEKQARASALRVGLGVGGTVIASRSRARPLHSCDEWVCDLWSVGVSSIFGLVRGTGTFTALFPIFVLVSRIQLA